MNQPAALYIHVPFCESRCTYCNFFSITEAPVPEAAYRKGLMKHLERFPRVENSRFDTLYCGGGTPSRMPAVFFRRVFEDLKERLNMDEHLEYTVEVNPEHADITFLDELHHAGINRISIGVQSLDDEILKQMGRIHSAATARKVIAEAAGRFSQVSVDFIIGVRGMDRNPEKIVPRDVLQDVQHISVYMLEGNRASVLGDEDESTADSYLALCEYLESEGLMQYEISNFARMGCRCRHNLHYWNGDNYVGLGPSAHSLWNGERIGAAANLEDFMKFRLDEEINPCPPSRLMREVMMLQLRTSDGADRMWFQERFGVDIFQVFGWLPERFPGLVIQRSECLRLTRQGMLLSNEIFEDVLLNDGISEV